MAGLCLLVAFPPYGWWPMAVFGVALLTLSVWGLRPRAGLLLATIAGLAQFVPMLAWTGLHTGTVPWLLLAATMAVQIGLFVGAPLGLVQPLLARVPWLCGPVVGALVTMQEAVRDRAPFGGFPWGRLAFSQANGPLVALAAIGGAPLVSFAVGCAGGLLAGLVVALPALVRQRRRLLRLAAGELAVLGVLACGCALVPLTRPAADAGSVTIAIVQGNVPRLGLDFNEQRRAVLDNHVRGTLALAERVRAGQVDRPDFVVWPENASDIDPLRNLDAAEQIDRAAAAVGVPILVGALVSGDDQIFNMSLVWKSGVGITNGYVKRHPVPFAEYIPLRPVARMVSKDVDRVGTDFVAGRGTGVVRLPTARLSPVICFEVAYDDLVRDSVSAGGQVLLVQTNNATFDEDEAAQQLAMVRLRAVEHGRPSLMASTVGISAFVRADGSVAVSSGFDVPATLVDVVRLPSAGTLATRLGVVPEVALVTGAIVAIGAAVLLRLRGRAAGTGRAGADVDGGGSTGSRGGDGGRGACGVGACDPADWSSADVVAGHGDGSGGRVAVSP